MSVNQHRPVLIVIAGPNGSGKTTITSKILKHEWLEGALYINPDQVAQDKFGDWNSPEALLSQTVQYMNALLIVSPDQALETCAAYMQQDFNKVEAQYQQSRKHKPSTDGGDGGSDQPDVTPVQPE